MSKPTGRRYRKPGSGKGWTQPLSFITDAQGIATVRVQWNTYPTKPRRLFYSVNFANIPIRGDGFGLGHIEYDIAELHYRDTPP